VELTRLDIYTQFLLPENCQPKSHKIIEATEIMLQLVAAGRGVAALPSWFVKEYEKRMPVKAVRLGKKGINKQIFLGLRESEQEEKVTKAFLNLAKSV